jgi:hypothetical protein
MRVFLAMRRVLDGMEDKIFPLKAYLSLYAPLFEILTPATCGYAPKQH